MKRLVLIDGNAILHRAYHALPPLTTKDGQLVNAVYGFSLMLLKVINDLAPTHMAVAFDRPEPTFRQEMYRAYQAQRPPMEEELVSQLTLTKEILKVMGIQTYEKPGYEADDVIGTITKKCQMSEVIIVTGDRDMLQLVDDHIKLYMPVKGLSEARLFNRQEVKEKFGVGPEQIVDYKALIGDPSDNYPGVAGVGPKTAVELLTRFGKVEKVYDALDKKKRMVNLVSERIAQALKEGRKEALLAKKLARIVTDMPIELDFGKLRLSKISNPETEALFKKLGFKSLLKRLKVEQDETSAKKKKRSKSKKKGNPSDNKQLSLL